MFGSLGAPELLFIFMIALLVLGPRRLPELGRALGRAVAEFRRSMAEFRAGIEKEIDLGPVHEARQALHDARKELADLAAAPMRVIDRELRQAESDDSIGSSSSAPAGAVEASSPAPAKVSSAEPARPSLPFDEESE